MQTITRRKGTQAKRARAAARVDGLSVGMCVSPLSNVSISSDRAEVAQRGRHITRHTSGAAANPLTSGEDQQHTVGTQEGGADESDCQR